MAEAAPAVDTGKFALLHTMIRVRDLDRSLDFYTRLLGMKVLRHKEYPGGEFTNVCVGYGDEATHTSIELTHNWGREEPYDLGTGWGYPPAWADEARRHRDRLNRGPRRLQDRADRVQVGGTRACAKRRGTRR